MSSLLSTLSHASAATPPATETAPIAAPVAANLPTAPAVANINAAPLHFADPAEPTSPAAMKIILQRFLQDFEYVELDYPVEGSAKDASRSLSYHPHIQFRMCGEDRKKLQPDQTAVYLGRQVDRGLFIMKKLGFEMDDFYVSAEKGTLSFDARIPNLPEGTTQHQALEQLAANLQQACKEARAAKKQANQTAVS